MNKRIVFSAILFFIILSPGIAQKHTAIEHIENFILPEEEATNVALDLENLIFLYENKANINALNYDELQSTGLLYPAQIQELIRYREIYGDLFSLNELQFIKRFDSVTVALIRPFFIAQNPELKRSLKERLKYTRSEILIRHDRQTTGIAPDKYGEDSNPYGYHALRLKVQAPGFMRIALTATQNYGESFRWKPQKGHYGYDHVSSFIEIEKIGIIKKVILGNFRTHFGQGLIMSGRRFTGKTYDALGNIFSGAPNLSATASSQAFGFRGLAGEIDLAKNWNLTVFAASTPRDARLDSLSQGHIIRSFDESGLHRDASELERKWNVRETNLGGALKFENYRFSAGIAFIGTNLSLPFEASPSRLDLAKHPEGKRFYSASAFTRYSFRDFHMKGEVAINQDKKIAGSVSALKTLAPGYRIGVNLRHYDAGFAPRHGNAFGEASNTDNESGFYIGLTSEPLAHLKISLYHDYFRFPWLKYNVDMPSDGNETGIQAVYSLYKKTEVRIAFRIENKEANDTRESVSQKLASVRTQKASVWLRRYFGENIRSDSRVNFNFHKRYGEENNGFLLSQDFSYELKRYDFKLRFATFNTDFYTRVTMYEPGILYDFNFPSYIGEGYRFVAQVRRTFGEKITFWFRYAITSATDPETNEIKRKDKLSTQIRIRF
ncbi:hypothetical protein FUAX_25670 [Fulvitalea axinellae]|uniref:Helix-hairpin-helix domain-containing protein n=1 Tax=Fulvitalea axinellae TaxID=1182444 RepID=A0AAU9DGI2_9BACT|nr:hypothetical protein FUAX_25670 [Fulvitalea axinellae]